MLRGVVALCVAAVLLLVGCGSSTTSSSAPVGAYVGTAGGSHAFVAVVAGKANAVVYVCDGRHGIGQLLTGRRSGGALSLRSAHGATASVTVNGDRASGTFTPSGGRPLQFVATPATGSAGFYRATPHIGGKPASVGWVVLGDGRQNGALTSAGRTVAAPTLSLGTATATLPSGATISATRISPGSVSNTSFGGGNFGGGGFGG